MKTLFVSPSGLLFALCFVLPARGLEIPALIVTGQNNHHWRNTTPVIATCLKDCSRFRVEVLTTPAVAASGAEWNKFNPSFKDSKVVVLNWTDFGADPAPGEPRVRPWMDELIRYVKEGGGLVVVHAGSFEHHADWPRLKGLGWSMQNTGYRLVVEPDGKVLRKAPGEGDATGHGKPSEWDARFVTSTHPITKGLPLAWRHCQDELWYSVRGPAENLEILATAQSAHTQSQEPVIWTVRYGEGRVFVTLLGHDAPAMNCTTFRTTLQRGAEWAATGKVSLPPPADFSARTEN